ncbi:MAG: Qat anti-phage system QueC-like protein QatC [Acidobacteriota bacterium]
MRRHVIIGRFGPGDRASVPKANGETATRLEFVVSKRRLEHGISNALDDLAKLGVFPSDIGLDLLVLAAHVHAADTRISRDTESQDSWTREIRLVVPVSDPESWITSTPLVQRLLNFLTGDRWTIGFRTRPAGFKSAVRERPPLLIKPPFNSLALFSGGLDSLIGAIDLLEEGFTPLFISHAGEGATSDSQKTLFAALKKYYSRQSFERLRIWMNFPNALVRSVGSEKTTRGRSFLFFAAGVFAGTGLDGVFTLRVPENGLIALNVPLDPLRLGALSTRTTHPFYISRWNDLLTALGIPGRIENPYWDKTKGEMVTNCRDRTLLSRLIPSSLSCSSPNKGRWLGRGIEHCGFCLPCLIRRAAIRKGLSGMSDPTSYTLMDLKANVLDTRQAAGQQVRSLQFTIQRLRQRPELATLFIHKSGPLSDESPTRRIALAEVYRRGLDELAVLLTGVQATPK